MFLPYHCLTFRTDHLVEPCAKNLSRAQALKEAHKHIGSLEACVDCKGKVLIKVPLPKEPKEYVSPERKGWDPVPEVTTAPLFLKDVYHPAPEVDKKESDIRQLSPEKIRKTREVVQRMAERFKKEPKRNKILPELPKIEDISGMDPDFTGKMSTEEYVRDMRGPKQEEIVPDVKITEKEAVKLGIVVDHSMVLAEGRVGGMPSAAATTLLGQTEPRYCPTHPEVVQRVDALGRFMGMCQECLVARGRKAGMENIKRGVSAPPVSIPLNLLKYAELKAWLVAKADDEDRTLQMQIMQILKQAWRQGT